MGFPVTPPDLCAFEEKCLVCCGGEVSAWSLGRAMFLSFSPFLSFPSFFSFLDYQGSTFIK